jgi:hypothetical protein
MKTSADGFDGEFKNPHGYGAQYEGYNGAGDAI